MNPKYLASIPPYLAIWAGLFLFKNVWVTLLGFHGAILFAILVLRPTLPLETLCKTAKTPSF